MGSSKSGRYPKGSTIKKINSKPFELKKQNVLPKPQSEIQKETPKPEPRIELVEEDLDFDSNAKRILAESEAAIAVDESKSKTKIESEPAAQNPEPIKKENWTPVVETVMQMLGSMMAQWTKIKEMEYTKEEIALCAPAANELINLWFPDVKALTPEQKIMLINGSILAQVHMTKLTIYMNHKAQKETPSGKPTEAQPAAA